MVIDTSAIMAMLRNEPEAERFRSLVQHAPRRLVSAVSILEAGIVTYVKAGAAGSNELDAFLFKAKVEVVAFDDEQATLAREAFQRFGKGQHAASLNFGDCAVYALAVSHAEPLLFKGDDFAKTDVTPALAS